VPEQAADTRRLASHESVLRLFAQAGVAAQQRRLDEMSGPERTMAEAIMQHQADAFAKDPYATGTALYPDVGPALPQEDMEGRLRQARMIEARRVSPVSAEEEPTDAPPGALPAPDSNLPDDARVWTDGQLPSQRAGSNLVPVADGPETTPSPSNDEPQTDVELAQAKPLQKAFPRAQQNQQKLERWAKIAAKNQKGTGPVPADWQTRLPPAALDTLYKEAATYKVPPEMLAAMIWAESKFSESASAGDKAQGKGLLGVSNIAIKELIRQNESNPTRKAQLEEWQKGDARMQAEPAISMAAEYLRLFFDKFGHSWVNAAAAYKSGETELRPFLRGQASAIDNEAKEGGKAKGYLSIVFDGNPQRYDSYR
jgi:hypothetical protein